MSLKVEKLAQDTFEQLEIKRKIAKLEKQKESLFERVVELAGDVSTRNIDMHLAAKKLNEVIADLQAS